MALNIKNNKFNRLFSNKIKPRILMGLAVASVQTQANDTLKIATRHDLPPYVYERADHGIEIDLIRKIAKIANLDVEFVQMPRIRMIQSFDAQQMDGILTQNPKASKVGCATEWYLKHQNFAFTLNDRELNIRGLDDLKSIRLVSFDGATQYLGPQYKNTVLQNPAYTEAADQSTHIALLYKGRFDAVVGDEWILKLAQRRYYETTGNYMKMQQHEILPASYYIARFHDQAICDAFNTALKNIRENGTYRQIVSTYYDTISMAGILNSPNQKIVVP